MKKQIVLLGFIVFLSSLKTLLAQDMAMVYNHEVKATVERGNTMTRHSTTLSNTDTIPGFETKLNKLKITGTVFKSDGITPAKDIILYIYQPNEEGDYERITNEMSEMVYHTAEVQTNKDGHYTFFTFVPGPTIVPLTYPRTRGFKYIHPVVKEPGKPEYKLDVFIFDDDPALTKRCRKKMERTGFKGILSLEKQGDIYVAKKDIVLEKGPSS